MSLQSQMTYFPTPEVMLQTPTHTIRHDDRTHHTSAEVFRETLSGREIGSAVLREVSTTLLSHRGDHPPTVLGALMQCDGQSAAELEARLIGVELSAAIMPTLDRLQLVGLVESYDDHGIVRYSLAAPEVQT